jgi:signal transduction histidine kinase/DNA-binding response OmpR family regulator
MAQILVVDDDPDVGRTLRDLLVFHGYSSILTAASGEEALERLSHEVVDLVLLDARLPGMSGFEACRRIRQVHGGSLPVLMLTAFGDREAVRRASEVGADDLLPKPVDTPALMLKVRACLRLKSLHDETVRHREEAQSRARDLALLHEIGRDWSLIAQPEEFYRIVNQRLASLIGAPVCLVMLYHPRTKTLAAALPAHGLDDETAAKIRYVVRPEYRSLWNFRTGRPYVSNRARSDTRLIPEMIEASGADSIVLVPMVSEGKVLGLLCAGNKPGGFSDADVHLLTIFAGPAATFLRSRQIFDEQRRHAEKLERLSDLMGAMAGTLGRRALLELTVGRVQKDLSYERVSFWAPDGAGGLRVEAEAGRSGDMPVDIERLKWALRGGTALQATHGSSGAELAVPVRAGGPSVGLLDFLRVDGSPFSEEEVSLLSALAGHLALALQKAASVAQTQRLADQLATLYDLGLETLALRDLRILFVKAAEEVGRLIGCDFTSVFRLEPDGMLRMMAAWAKQPSREPYPVPSFKPGEGIAGRVARDAVPALVNDVHNHRSFVPRGNPIARLLCVPVTFYDQERRATAVFGVLNATRGPGSPPFGSDDLQYLTRFAGQLSIAVANSMAFAAERERSEQLALVNALMREIAANLSSRERVFDAAARRIHETFRYPVVTIGVVEPASGLLRMTAAVGLGGKTTGLFPLKTGISGRAMREKKTMVVQDVSVDPDYLALVPTTLSEVAVPILSGDDVIAVLNVESNVLAGFNRSQVITLETLAEGIGILLRNAELYEALERTNAKLVELDRLKSELVNIVAHDFRAPIAGILGYAELLEWKPDAPIESRVESARAIISAATHVSSLVDKTLKTSRLETGQFPFEFGVVDLGSVVRGVMARFPGSPRHVVQVDVPEDPLPCWADRERLAEVVENLLSNAVKYSPAGGPIHLEVLGEGEGVTVRISDTGIGIAPEDMRRLFRPFSRVRGRGAPEVEGSGLGLYICERIVRAHGGRLWADSRPGQGSTFSFAMPLFGLGAQTRRPVILVAAADESTRREARRVVEDLGYAVHEAGDGVEAVEAAIRLRPTAVVLDRVLPRLNAEEVAERLQHSGTTQGVPLFVLAAEGDLGDRATLFRACVPKPMDRAVLTAALEALVGQAPASR